MKNFHSLLAVLLLALLPTTASAYDFMIGNLCYNKNSDGKTVYVTYQNSPSSPSTPGYSNLSGALTIPATVTYSGTTYSVTSIGDYAFSGCSDLTSATIPNSVTSIGNYAFFRCHHLTSVSIPNSVTSIGDYAFCNCSSMTSVTIPNSVTSISEGAFVLCSSLTRVTIGNSVTTIGIGAFSNCSGLTSVTIPNSVTTISSLAFSGCSGLTGTLSIPSSVTNIGSEAFHGCNGLMTLKIGNSTGSTVVGDEAFKECEGLTSIYLPASLSALGESAFDGCTGLTDVYCYRPRPINIDATVFKNVPVNGGCDLHVPAGSKIRYEAMAVWQDFLFIFEDAHDDEPTPTPTNGDVNGDGRVNVSDVSALINIILGIQ